MRDDLAAAWTRLGWIDEDAERDRRRENPQLVVEAETVSDLWPGEVGSIEDAARRDPQRWRPWGDRWLAGEEDETW